VEPWEAEKSIEDMEYYDWDKNKSRIAYITLKYWPQKLEPSEMERVSLDDDAIAKEYKEAVTSIFNDGE
jgi:small subunit ribosomal protein S35